MSFGVVWIVIFICTWRFGSCECTGHLKINYNSVLTKMNFGCSIQIISKLQFAEVRVSSVVLDSSVVLNSSVVSDSSVVPDTSVILDLSVVMKSSVVLDLSVVVD